MFSFVKQLILTNDLLLQDLTANRSCMCLCALFLLHTTSIKGVSNCISVNSGYLYAENFFQPYWNCEINFECGFNLHSSNPCSWTTSPPHGFRIASLQPPTSHPLYYACQQRNSVLHWIQIYTDIQPLRFMLMNIAVMKLIRKTVPINL